MNRVRKRIILCLFIFTLVFLSSDIVLAETGSCGEVRYDITDFNINNEKITIKVGLLSVVHKTILNIMAVIVLLKKLVGDKKLKLGL